MVTPLPLLLVTGMGLPDNTLVFGLMDRLPPARRLSWSGRSQRRELPNAAEPEGTPIPETR